MAASDGSESSSLFGSGHGIESNPLIELDRISSLARGDVFVQRLYYVCYMTEAAQKYGYQSAAPILVPLCVDLSVDDEPEIRQALAEQLPQLAKIFTEDGSENALHDVATLIHINHTLLTDDVEEVQLTAEQAFAEMATSVKPIGRSIQQDVLKVALRLADSKDDGQRVCAANLMTGFAESLDEAPFQEIAIPKIATLCRDPEFRVRKAVALGLPRCCRALSGREPIVDSHLIPMYVELSGDTVWAVRMACAEGLVRIAEAVSGPTRASQLAPVVERLARDASNWVRDSSLQTLGSFLALLHGSQELSDQLVALFTKLTLPNPGDNRLQLYCAYNFPAVVQSLGRQRWVELQPAYANLIGSNQIAVRRSLGYSLHELAEVLGEELSQMHLIGPFSVLMADVDEVRVGVSKNLVHFLSCLPQPSRLPCVHLLPAITSLTDSPPPPPPPVPTDTDTSTSTSTSMDLMSEGVSRLDLADTARPLSLPADSQEAGPTSSAALPDGRGGYSRPVRVISAKQLWQLRKTIAEQLVAIAFLLDGEDIRSLIVPYTFHLCRDPVAAVRQEAAKQLGALIPSLLKAGHLPFVLSILEDLRAMAASQQFRDRQMFCVACQELVQGISLPLFQDHLLHSLEEVSQDHVPNVRIMAAEALLEAFNHSGALMANATVRRCLVRLLEDSDRDVRSIVNVESLGGVRLDDDAATSSPEVDDADGQSTFQQYVASYVAEEESLEDEVPESLLKEGGSFEEVSLEETGLQGSSD